MKTSAAQINNVFKNETLFFFYEQTWVIKRLYNKGNLSNIVFLENFEIFSWSNILSINVLIITDA